MPEIRSKLRVANFSVSTGEVHVMNETCNPPKLVATFYGKNAGKQAARLVAVDDLIATCRAGLSYFTTLQKEIENGANNEHPQIAKLYIRIFEDTLADAGENVEDNRV